MKFDQGSVVPVNRDRLYEQVVQQIQGLIITAGLPAGGRIPTERELGEQFGVSRTVIREALKTLAERGLIDIRAGRGAFVAELGTAVLKEPMRLFYQRQDVSYEELVESRRALETEIVPLATQRARPEQIEKMRAAISQMDECLDDLEGFIKGDHAFHVALAEATQNKIFLILTDSIGELVYEGRRLLFGVNGAPGRGQAGHSAILDAVERHDVAAAQKAMQAHLDQFDRDLRTAVSRTSGTPA